MAGLQKRQNTVLRAENKALRRKVVRLERIANEMHVARLSIQDKFLTVTAMMDRVDKEICKKCRAKLNSPKEKKTDD